ncbi:uncharacterized protein EURHEDRAFT_399710 [Aspergillus ruber CBS 135680]|uniref:WSC domain-containing protein n=1 Tax=Aspergillus ruber (strain CBS 135680) TaxID=1388766 RepID=A0A017SN58_ASPRC|nr:uncharacterized protein EURHEDRAFT_399710 [Aspergillus ruber CBS 135680]EYE98413.1 hypothetical protein EURHEDRAFT_399710 [Aspergillus ruber CBS 135680]
MLLAFAFSWLLLLASPVFGAENSVKYCSSVNTGSDNDANTDTFQSVGACTSTCTSDYAFGILQGKNCWCSNVAPNKATNVNVSECNDGCPGYPSDNCGNVEEGLYGYIVLMDHMPSSTASASGASSTGTSTGTSTETTGASTTNSGDSKVETIGGQVQTVTVGGSGATAAADTSSTSSKDSDSGLSNGAVAGVAVGSVAGFLAILALILIWYCSKKRQRANSPDPSMQLLDGRNSKGSQMSFMRSVFSDNTTLGGSPTATRNPNATFIDNRMKTNTVLYPNGPRDSSVSLQDNEDYSRPVLRATNPD